MNKIGVQKSIIFTIKVSWQEIFILKSHYLVGRRSRSRRRQPEIRDQPVDVFRRVLDHLKRRAGDGAFAINDASDDGLGFWIVDESVHAAPTWLLVIRRESQEFLHCCWLSQYSFVLRHLLGTPCSRWCR